MFLGPTGVGKTETAKELARLLHFYEEDEAFLRIDCSQFSDKSDLPTLLGASPKYVGREQKPLLNPDIIHIDRSVVLFDEIEKGDPELHDMLLQILEEGEVTLHNGGQAVSFRNSIIIMTSNVGSQEMMKLASGKRIGFTTEDETGAPSKKALDDTAHKALKNKFKPEFINRIDHKITYSPLTDEQLCEVLDVYVSDMVDTPAYVSRNIKLTVSPELLDHIVQGSEHRDEMGARPVIRQFESTVQRDLVRSIANGSIPNNTWVYATIGESDESMDNPQVEFYSEPIKLPRKSRSTRYNPVTHIYEQGEALAMGVLPKTTD